MVARAVAAASVARAVMAAVTTEMVEAEGTEEVWAAAVTAADAAVRMEVKTEQECPVEKQAAVAQPVGRAARVV